MLRLHKNNGVTKSLGKWIKRNIKMTKNYNHATSSKGNQKNKVTQNY